MFKKPWPSVELFLTIKTEVVNYNRDAGTDIYAMFLDASKAFDRVIYVIFFYITSYKRLKSFGM